MANNTLALYEDNPNHMIIWLDSTIGKREHCIHLKEAFSTTIDPVNENPVKLIDRDYDEPVRNAGPSLVNFEDVWFFLAAFDNVDQCIECFGGNQNKRIFFITSGTMGRTAVPIILNRFRYIFTDPLTDEPYDSVYVFCHNIEWQMAWALEYRDYIQIFNHDADLLVRIVRDIADYYVTGSKRLLDEDPPNNSAADQRLHWAHVLYQRYEEIERVSLQKELNEVNQILENIKKELVVSSEDDD